MVMTRVGCPLQGAQLMSKFGINVPDGIAAKTVDEVEAAAKKMQDEKGEVHRSTPPLSSYPAYFKFDDFR